MKKHIYVYSPSSAVRDKAAFKRGVKRLVALGHEVEVDRVALSTHQRFAGDDATRLDAVYRAAASGADVALISRGGYGVSRLLPELDLKILEGAIAKGTKFVGYSDFTPIQMALLARSGTVSWAGPSVAEDFGLLGGADDIMEDCFDDFITGRGEGAGWQLPKTPASKVASTGNTTGTADQQNDGYTIENAVLWGGNLSMLASLVGTPYLPIVENGILFIEDVAEHPYRVERMLIQLLQAGILARQQAIIFGQFNHYRLVPHDKGYKLDTVVQWLKTKVSAKVLTGLPFGHVATKVMLPVGKRVTLVVEGRDALLLWPHNA